MVINTSPSLHYKHLKSKWLKKHQKVQKKLWGKHKNALDWAKESTKQAVVGSLAGILMLTAPLNTALLSQVSKPENQLISTAIDKRDQLRVALSSILPKDVSELTIEQEQSISDLLTRYYNMPVTAVLDGIRLNRSYGYIGKEQHLMRFPGDTVEQQITSPQDAVFASSGMAPGRGAWGYFAQDGVLTEKDIQREKYYIAVQTFLAPGWIEDPLSLYHFFKFRKMLVVNPENGKAVVAVIGDAGPGVSTGKHLGGSPELMAYLERVDGAQKGPVLYFFINDPLDLVPLGPVGVQ